MKFDFFMINLTIYIMLDTSEPIVVIISAVYLVLFSFGMTYRRLF